MIACPRCGSSECGCYGEDPRWPRWVRFYSEKWSLNRAETERRLVNMQLRGDDPAWGYEPRRVLEQIPNLPFWEEIRRETE